MIVFYLRSTTHIKAGTKEYFLIDIVDFNKLAEYLTELENNEIKTVSTLIRLNIVN